MDTDKNGKPWAKYGALRPGDHVIVADGFDCMPAGAMLEVQGNSHEGLWISCSHGRHSLLGQLDDDDNSLLGIYVAEGSPQE